jgi:putative oxidoreductase
LQRLFSTFANGWPGLGLIVLRLAISASLIHGFFLRVPGEGSSGALGALAAGTAAFLLIGLWTPIAGATAVGIELWMAFSRPPEFWPSVLSAAIGLSLILLGPGARSIDAVVYGRKRISISDR